MSISAVIVVYNEEKRIEDTLKCIKWCNEIIVIDRNSTDQTREIAKKYTDKIFVIPNREFDPNDNRIWLEKVQSEWVLGLTASDVMHPQLAEQIKKLTEDMTFSYDMILVPFRRFVLGLETKRSPWYTELNHNCVFRKDIVRINSREVHGALQFDTKRKYKLPESKEYCVYHLTHNTVDQMMDRHLNYCRVEGQIFSPDLPLRKGTNAFFRSLYIVFIRNKTLLMGWNGVALSFAYISYWMLRFLYIWEKRMSKADETYSKIRQNITTEWNNKKF